MNIVHRSLDAPADLERGEKNVTHVQARNSVTIEYRLRSCEGRPDYRQISIWIPSSNPKVNDFFLFSIRIRLFCRLLCVGACVFDVRENDG